MKCLIVDDMHPCLIQSLESNGFVVDYHPLISRADALEILSSYQVLVVRSKFFVDASIMESAPDLMLIARAGAGLDNIDVDEAEKRNITVVHAAEGNSDAVAEHTVGMILGLLSKIAFSDRQVRLGIWDREGSRGIELKGKTVGILGYGNMGTAVAKRLVSFGCNVIAFDKYLETWPDNNAERVDIETLISQTEILSLHIPLTSETMGMVNSDFLLKFRKGLFLINTSRGGIVPVEDVLWLMEQGHISGLGLDVLENEPPAKKNQILPSKYEKLFGRNDVVLSPHVAGWSTESYEKISIVLAEKILHCFSLLKREKW
jgi:D-3-phosphoglycerate dehydrogenase